MRIVTLRGRPSWGAKVIDRLSADLREAFPEMRGFSPLNLKYTRAFVAAWPKRAIVQEPLAQIPWFHNCFVLDRISDPGARWWYVEATRKVDWSRSTLVLSFVQEAPARLSWSDLAQRAFKVLPSACFSPFRNPCGERLPSCGMQEDRFGSNNH